MNILELIRYFDKYNVGSYIGHNVKLVDSGKRVCHTTLGAYCLCSYFCERKLIDHPPKLNLVSLLNLIDISANFR